MDTLERANTESVRTFITAFWDGDDGDVADQFVTADYGDHAYAPPDVTGLKNQYREFAAAFSERHHTIEDIVACADKVLVRLTLRAVNSGPFRGSPSTNTSIEVAVYRTYRLVDGKIAEHWALLDTATLLRRLGFQPSPANACKR
jgi:predicted ester cyclase